MAKKKAKKKTVKKTTARTQPRTTSVRTTKKLTRSLAVVAFLLNVLVFILPGIGSLIGGKTKTGIWQLVLAVIGILLSMTLSLTLLGLPILLVAWIWGIITGIEILRESE